MMMFKMKKLICLSFVFAVTSETSLAKNTFLDDLKTEYSSLDDDTLHSDPYINFTKSTSNIFIPGDNPLGNSSYGTKQKHELHMFTGDKCKQQIHGQWGLEAKSKENQEVTCYIGHFPDSGIKTHMQSNDNDDYSVGFSWEFD